MCHVEHHSTNGILRLVANCVAWKHTDNCLLESKEEPRNLHLGGHLGLALDGIYPFGIHFTTWTTWLVVIVNYNIAPWMTIKKGCLMLIILIPGKYKVKDINIYMAPLIKEVHFLCGHQVNITGMLMWTMCDFSKYRMLVLML